MARDRYRISLRIRHPTMTASAVCAALPMRPGRIWTVGTPRTNPRGVTLGGVHAETYCVFDVTEGEGSLADALGEAADRMTRHAEQFSEIRAGGGSVEFFVGWFLEGGNSGDAFEPELLARLGALGIRLSLDIYQLPEEDVA